MSDTQATTTSSANGTGLDPKISGLLSWVFGATVVVPLILFLIEKDKFAKFHAMQALIWGIVFFVISIILSFTFFGLCCVPFLYIVNIFGAVKAYQGEMYKFPLIGDIAEQQASK